MTKRRALPGRPLSRQPRAEPERQGIPDLSTPHPPRHSSGLRRGAHTRRPRGGRARQDRRPWKPRTACQAGSEGSPSGRGGASAPGAGRPQGTRSVTRATRPDVRRRCDGALHSETLYPLPDPDVSVLSVTPRSSRRLSLALCTPAVREPPTSAPRSVAPCTSGPPGSTPGPSSVASAAPSALPAPQPAPSGDLGRRGGRAGTPSPRAPPP